MKILKVIHGYPFRYNAGSEVYSQMLCHELVKQGHEVVVFTRQEDAYKPEYSVEWERDPLNPNIRVFLINKAHSRDGYQHIKVDQAFEILLKEFKPDIVHIGHLNHLSTSIVGVAHEHRIPIVFTLHDFWLMCPRGQFLQATNSLTNNLYPVCNSQDNQKCAKICYSRYFSSQEDEEDLRYWTRWVEKRMAHIKEMSRLVDLYIAPSHYLRNRFIHDFAFEPSKIVYLDYGFNRERLKSKKRTRENEFVFGYIGTHKQAKGIFHLIQAFTQTHENAVLKIWGSPLEPFTKSLKSYIRSLGKSIEEKIFWMGGYRNDLIVDDVFNHVDAIVVPSIWGENSPLVIHEALEAKVPIITSNFGGMKEYVEHEINGLLFEHRNSNDLSMQMSRLKSDPLLATTLTSRGYLQSDDGHIPSIEEHGVAIFSLYSKTIEQRMSSYA